MAAGAYYIALAWLAGPIAGALSGHRTHHQAGLLTTAVRLLLHGPHTVYHPAPPAWLVWTVIGLLWLPPVVGASVWIAARWARNTEPAGAAWAGRRDEERLAVPRDPARRTGRVVVGRSARTGRLLATEPGVSAVVFGPTGSGKTSYLAVPAALEWDGPLVMATAKAGDITGLLTRRRQLGPVRVVAPFGAEGLPTDRWSPVAYANTEQTATWMADWLVDAAHAGSHTTARGGDNREWRIEAARFLKPLLLAANLAGAGLDGFVTWVNQGPVAAPQVSDVLRGAGFAEVAEQYESIWRIHDKGIGSVLFTSHTIIAAYGDPDVRATAATSDFTAEELLDPHRPGTLIILAPPSVAETYAPVFTALIATVIRAAEHHYEITRAPLRPGLLLDVDEAGNVLRYPKLPQLLTTGRAMGIQALTFWHDLAQLHTVFPKAAGTITSNSKLRVLLPGCGDLETLKYFSELLGRTWVRRSSRTTNADGRISRSRSEQTDALAPLHLLQQLQQGEAVAQYDNLPPVRLRTRNVHTDPALQALLHTSSGPAGLPPRIVGHVGPTASLDAPGTDILGTTRLPREPR